MPKQHFKMTCPELSHEKQSSYRPSPPLSVPISTLSPACQTLSEAGGWASRNEFCGEKSFQAGSAGSFLCNSASTVLQFVSLLFSSVGGEEVQSNLSLWPQHRSRHLTQCRLNKCMWGRSVVMHFTVGSL